jgi:hypothetical protein
MWPCVVYLQGAGHQQRYFAFRCIAIGINVHLLQLLIGYSDRLRGLVVSVADYKHRGPGSDSRALFRIFLRELGLERGPLSLVIG